ncbi:MAG TPA: hypothetical protein VGU65_10675 [Frateuria sp.]|uniref:hypothetical protein n=1 Tax=Frateuria sp. TaxID=2211372 RepID=UPI002DF44E5F|nr:hypothetical protein [Frateuria sp.]
MAASDLIAAAELMDQFAQRTGLDSGTAPVRYLWTDAFAACNFQYLAEAGADARFDALAQRTVEQVHELLGHFRADDTRSGWLRGACGQADGEHPTRAGLRIGKPLPERASEQAFDERLEWERDGQYFHYLTRWMRALEQLGRRRGEPHLTRWARELADTAHRAFTHAAGGGRKRMYWKMSTDLSRPLVPSMGQHDPLDGLVTALALRTDATPEMDQAIADYRVMMRESPLATGDPLGLGSLLMDALRLEELLRAGHGGHGPLLEHVLENAAASLPHLSLQLGAPAELRLGFRELGLAIGLGGLKQLAVHLTEWPPTESRRMRPMLEALLTYLPLRQAIQAFWLDPVHRRSASWREHRDINEVMLATSLLAGTDGLWAWS